MDHAILADEQGLGKTVQAIDAADKAWAWDVLVVCKAIAKINWAREFAKWSTADPPAQVVGMAPRPGGRWAQAPGTRARIAGEGLVVVNYDIIHHPRILRQLVKRRWDLIVADEMHSLKAGQESRRAQAMLDPGRGLWRTADQVWGLSGTPAPNHVGELYPWLRAMHPNALRRAGAEGDYHSFLKTFTKFRQTPYGVKVYGNKSPGRLRELLAPYLLRRRQADVLPELPALRIDQMTLVGAELPELAALEESADFEAILEIIDGLDPDENPEAALRAAMLDPATVRRLTGLAKGPAVIELVREELSAGTDKIVLMCWHREVVEALARGLEDYRPVAVYGGASPRQQQTAVDQFQGGDSRVFLGNVLSAGTSITLTAAHRGLFVEWDWVPGNNEQAIRRLLRIGQGNAVRWSFIGLAGSMDEAISAAYARKARNVAEVLD